LPSAAERIFLCGPPGCGKTTIGGRLAKALGRPFIDTDAVVVERAGMPIHEIFERFGERAFRAFESSALAEACAVDGAVVALGGGTLVAPENRERVAGAGRTIYLRVPLATLEGRVKRQRVRRPLLATIPIGTLLEGRRTVYEAADHTIDVEGRPAEAVVAAIKAMIA
jgi:shikimate kinase